MAGDLTLTIERLSCRVNLAAGGANPGQTADAAERIARDELQTALAGLDLSQFDDEAVYRVRKLRLTLWLDPNTEPDVGVAQRWSQALGRAVTHALRNADGGRVIRFESPHAFVLNFLRDLVDGRAWQHWYYDEFGMLRMLPDERAALEVLVQRPSLIVALLRALMASGHGDRLVTRWRAAELARLWAALGLTFTPQSHSHITWQIAHIAPMWRKAAQSGQPDADARASDTLRLWLDAPSQDASTFGLARMLVDLAALMRQVPETRGLLLMQSPIFPSLKERLRARFEDTLNWMSPLQATESGRLLLAQVATLATSRIQAKASEGALSSAVGSVWLTLMTIKHLGVWEMWTAHMSDDDARRCLFVLALKLLGRKRAVLCFADPLLAAFAGLVTAPLADARLPLEADSGAPAWVEALPDIAARISPVTERMITAAAAGGLDVLRDAAAGVWLATRPATADPFGGWAGHLKLPTPLDQAGQAQLAAEVTHLYLGPKLGFSWLTPSLDAALSVVASLVLRRFAASLVRFVRSSPDYLAAQFLAQPAQLLSAQDQLVLTVTGGPLRMVLELMHLPEQLAVPWLSTPVTFRLTGAPTTQGGAH